MDSSGRVRVGILGGSFGATFQFHLHPDSVVQAVCEANSGRLQHLGQTYGCDTHYSDYQQLLDDPSIDAIGVFSGAPDHARHSIMALKAGKHVMCAVPAVMSIEEAAALKAAVDKSGKVYMMAETSHYQQSTISARQFYQEGRFGDIYFTEAEYHHAGLEELFIIDGKRTWRYGFPPMHYPTHCTAFLTGVTGERLVEVSCIGWGDDSRFVKDNQYDNPFWNETALFKTDKGHAFRVAVYWFGAHRGCERAQWYGEKMSFFMAHPNGMPPTLIHTGEEIELDHGGFSRHHSPMEIYNQPDYWATDMLPETLRFNSGHDGSHTFLTHEFIRSIIENRDSAINIREALTYTVPGIIAHQSALQNAKQLQIPQFD